MAAEEPKQGYFKWDSPHGSVKIHYVEKGSGSRHLFLIHGFAAHTYTWHAIIEPLAAAGYHVWAIDIIGFGLSDKPPGMPYGLDLFLEQIEAFMKAKQIPKAHVVGNSMGGGIALGMALSHPEQVESLTLIDAMGYPMDLPYYFSLGRTFGSTLKPLMGKFTTRLILRHIMYDPEKITDEQVEAYAMPYQTPGGVEAAMDTLSAFDNNQLEQFSARFHHIKVPVLLIWGENDTLIPLSFYHKFRKEFPQAETLLIPLCGHIPQEECPELVVEKMLRFLETLGDVTHRH